MKDNDERYLSIADKDGKITEYEILFTFDREDKKKSYIVFTDNTKDENGSIATYAAIYTKLDNKYKLEAIESDEEWDLIENILAQYEEKTSE